MTLPFGYQRRLQRFDPGLRVVWDEQQEEWRLEQKVRRSTALPRPYAFMPRATAQALNDGYRLHSTFEPRALPPVERLIRNLQRGDAHAHGWTVDQIARAQDDREAERKARPQASSRRETQAHIRDVIDTETWNAGERVTVPADVG